MTLRADTSLCAAAAGLVLAGVLAGCRGGTTRSSGPSGCVVLYFAAEATKGQEDAVRSRLERDKRVRSVRFVSKDEALALMTKKYPALTKSLASNPLPDSLRVAVSRSDADLLRASLEPVRPPVDSVDASAKPCGTGQ